MRQHLILFLRIHVNSRKRFLSCRHQSLKKEGENNRINDTASELKPSLRRPSRYLSSGWSCKTTCTIYTEKYKASHSATSAVHTLQKKNKKPPKTKQQVFSTVTFKTVLNGFFWVPSPVESLPSRSETYSSSVIHDKYRE